VVAYELRLRAVCTTAARAPVTQLVTSRRNPSLLGENLRRLVMRIAVSKALRFSSGFAVMLGVALIGARAHAEEGTEAAAQPQPAAQSATQPAPQSGPALYRWVTADGTVSYTDDAKRVPERYRDSAQTIERGMLSDYGRYTATDGNAHQAEIARLEKRLDALRAMNARDGEPAGAAPIDAPAASATAAAPATRDIHRRQLFVRPDGSTYYRYYTNQTSAAASGASLPVDPNDPNPVVTEERHVKVPGEPITQRVVITRQGDRVLSIEQPRTHYHSVTFPELSEIE
jgi:hypothetical protein